MYFFWRNLLALFIMLCPFTIQAVAQDLIQDLDIHLFVSQGFIKSSEGTNWPVLKSGKGSFQFNEYGFNIAKQINPKLRVGMQVFGQDRGDYGNDTPTVDWAYGDYRFKDYLGIRLGKVKMPLGIYNETRDADFIRTFILLPQGLYSDRRRDATIAQTGLALYGSLPARWLGRFAYQFHVGSIPANANSGIAMDIGNRTGLNLTSLDSKTSYAVNLDWNTPIKGLRLSGVYADTGFDFQGASLQALYSRYRIPLGTIVAGEIIDFHRAIFSAEYTWRELIVAAEYNREKSKTIMLGNTTPSQNDTYYISATYRFNKYVGVGGYYNYLVTDNRHRDGSTYAQRGLYHPYNMWEKDFDLTLRVDLNQYWLFKVEGHKINGTDGMIPLLPTNKEDWWLFAAKTSLYW